MGGPIQDPTSDEWYFDGSLLPAPEPAPGAPILTSVEQQDMASLLSEMVSNNTNPGVADYGNHFIDDQWSNEGPPQLLNLSSSFGQLDGLSPVFFHDVQQRDPATTTSAMLPTSVATAPPGNFGVSDTALTTAPITNTASDPTLSTAPPIANNTTSYYSPSITVPPQHSPVHQHSVELSQPTDDVLNAAMSLTQHGYHARSNSIQGGSGFSNLSQRPANQTMGPPVGHLRHQPLDEFVQEGRRNSQSQDLAEQQAVLKYWMTGGKQSSERTSARKPAPIPLQYGSDQRFNNSNQPFVPRTRKESTEAMTEEHLKYMKCVELAPNSGNDSPTTAIFNGNNIPPLNLKTRGPSTAGLKIEPNGDFSKWPGGRSGGDDEDDDAEEPQSAVSKSSARKRKSKAGNSNSPSAADGAPTGKRRKSAAVSKRENLTEDQKRENHINSEKKRRKVIQTGFDNLGILVPNLKGGNQSKSIMLDSTVAFIKDLLAGNEQLSAQLCQM